MKPVESLIAADDPIGALGLALKESGARVTIDRHRSIALPCVLCDTTSEPRDLVEIGRYTRPMSGGLQPGTAPAEVQ